MQQLPPHWPCFIFDSGLWETQEMFRVDGNYLYRLGSQIHPLSQLRPNSNVYDIFYAGFIAEGGLEPFLRMAAFGVRTCLQQGQQLLEELRALRAHIEPMTQTQLQPHEPEPTVEAWRIYGIQEAAKKFEAVLAAELGTIDLYFITQKGTYRTHDMVTNGIAGFPAALTRKVPGAIFDVNEACKCLVLELPTACGFHLHRANEAVLRKYWDAVTGGKPAPGNRTISDYLRAFGPLKKGSPKVKAALRDLNKLHRNPLIHPEDTLNVDQAMALMGAVHAVMVPMLDAVPEPPPSAQVPTATVSASGTVTP